MRPDNHDGGESLPLTVAKRIDGVCARFESGWQTGQGSRIEDFLGDVQGAERETLLWELLRIEIDHRLRQGSVPTVEEYLCRFPGRDKLLREEIEARIALATEKPRPDDTLKTPGDVHGVKTVPYVGGPTPEVVVPGYEILGPLGEGGMAKVYRAHDADFDRSLAIKVMKADLALSAEAEKQFLAEARITGRLQHPGIPPVHEIGRLDDGRPFLAMKLIEGKTLHDLLSNRPAPAGELPRFVAVFGQVCQAVGYAHSQGVIHRDLKPANLMMGAFGEVQVMDWGLARERGSREVPAVVLGTPAFMAPEQARGESEHIDERADVFGLGAILCVILTGKPPFEGVDISDVLAQARMGRVARAFARLDACGADAELLALTKQCLAANLEQRPCDAGKVAAAVQAYQTGVEERARKAEMERARAEARAKAERRARRLTLGLAAVLLLAVIGGGIGAWVIQLKTAANAQGIRTTMDQGRSLLKEGWEQNNPAKLAEAKAAAERALAVARGSNASTDLQHEAEALRDEIAEKIKATNKNSALLAALSDVYEPRETHSYKRNEMGQMVAPALPSAEQQFTTAFGGWTIKIDSDPVEEIVARLARQPQPVVQEVVAGLDAWALERRRRKPPRPAAEWRRLLAVAERLDRNSLRKKLRRLLADSPLERTAANAAAWDRTREDLRKLAAQVQAGDEPVLGVLALTHALHVFKETAAAEGKLRAALARRPREVVLLNALGQLLERQQPPRLADAIGCYRAARAARPELGIALSRALIDVKQAPEAAAVILDLAGRGSATPDLSLYLGNALYAQKKLDEAVAAYRQAIKLQRNYAEAYNNLGNALREQKILDEAVAACRQAIKLRPDLAEGYNNLGVALAGQKKLDEAVAAFRKAIKLQPDFAKAYNNLGVSLREQKKLDEAVAACRQAIKLQPDLAEAYNNLGIALADQKKLEEAVAAYHRAIELKPDYAEAYCNLGIALAGQKKLDEAVAAYRHAIRIKPDYAVAYFNLSTTLADQKKLEEAVAACRQAVELKPDYAEAYCNLGIDLAGQKKLDEAVAAFRQAIQLKPDFAEAYFNLGIVLAELKKLDEAVAAYRQAIKLQPDDALAYYNLGVALREQKKLDEAVAALRQAVQRMPNHPGLLNNLRVTERWLELDKKLPALLTKKGTPRSPQERIELAAFCITYKRHYAAAVGFLSEAFTAEPKLAGDLRAQRRYHAARAAILAAAGKGEDAKDLNAEQRGKFRQQTLDWLRADLDAYTKFAEKDSKAARQAVQQRLSHWLQDADLATVRDARELAALPEEQRKVWQKLWEDVAALLKKCR